MPPLTDSSERGTSRGSPVGPETLRTLEAAGYSAGSEILPSRPDRSTIKLRTRGGNMVVAKIYSNGAGSRVFQTMRRLWESPFGRQRTRAGLAEPLDYIPEIDAVIVQWLQGRALIEFGAAGVGYLTESMRLLADLHTCGVVPETRRTWRGTLRSLERKMLKVAETAPDYKDHLQPIVDTLGAKNWKDTELVCAHGDFSARNVLVTEEGCVLVDWDRLQQADPARDVAYFAVWPWREAIREGRIPDRRGLEAAVQTYLALRPGVRLDKQLPFHVAAGIVRMCCSLITLWPEQSYLVPGLAKAASQELERAE